MAPPEFPAHSHVGSVLPPAPTVSSSHTCVDREPELTSAKITTTSDNDAAHHDYSSQADSGESDNDNDSDSDQKVFDLGMSRETDVGDSHDSEYRGSKSLTNHFPSSTTSIHDLHHLLRLSSSKEGWNARCERLQTSSLHYDSQSALPFLQTTFPGLKHQQLQIQHSRLLLHPVLANNNS